jgi:hypothetical protein
MAIETRNIEIVDDAMAEVLRRMTVGQRLAAANRMWLSARKAINHMLRFEHPEWTSEEIARETTRRMSDGAV